MLSAITGDYPRFGNMIVTGDPCSGGRNSATLVQYRGIFANSRTTPTCCAPIRCSSDV